MKVFKVLYSQLFSYDNYFWPLEFAISVRNLFCNLHAHAELINIVGKGPFYIKMLPDKNLTSSQLNGWKRQKLYVAWG